MDWMFGIPNSLKSDWKDLSDGLLRPRCEGSKETKLLPRLGPHEEAINLGNSPFGGGGVWVGTNERNTNQFLRQMAYLSFLVNAQLCPKFKTTPPT
ncbi:hypothetical protein AVEN_193143-1 [Araneus ventricosus]|uniref:Uncharacterized protein n=1 Tax=Araneus ventricosus TaxID=182803 RepID=A0A4Y2B1H3_ARAVE|nr:hypothetical protein AVEN_193143-1 [Araneus ventricosus]